MTEQIIGIRYLDFTEKRIQDFYILYRPVYEFDQYGDKVVNPIGIPSSSLRIVCWLKRRATFHEKVSCDVKNIFGRRISDMLGIISGIKQVTHVDCATCAEFDFTIFYILLSLADGVGRYCKEYIMLTSERDMSINVGSIVRCYTNEFDELIKVKKA